MKDVLSDDKFTELKDEAEVKAMEAVVESISIYYEDEAWNFIKDKIDSFFENYVSSVENAENF
jgi:transcriptional antiterminator Rof (Rho-off)